MKRRVLAWIALACALGSARARADGLYADFATSLGDFSVRLDYERAPRAVASFVGLATGAGGWLDERSNLWRRPFYDGSIFHRVVKDANTNGMAIQGGGYLWRSVNTNTGVVSTNFSGPGYALLENVTNGLLHSNGVISMANSGPNTDGSQFFVTATNVPFWDGGYTIFGHVVSGMPVVATIAAVPVQGAGSRPVADVVLSNVTIRRVGASAEAFDIAAQGVPVPESGPMRTFASGTNQMLVFDIVPQVRMALRESRDLRTWEVDDWGLYAGAAFVWTTAVSRAELGDHYFFHMSRVRFPVPITAPASQRSRTFTFNWDSPDLTYSATFSSHPLFQGAGWVKEGTNAPVARTIFVGDGWTRDAYMGRLYFMDDLAREYNYSLGFNPGQPTNRFTGTWNAFGDPVRHPIAGTFTLE